MLEMQIVDPERNPDGLLRHDYEFYSDAVKQIDTNTLAQMLHDDEIYWQKNLEKVYQNSDQIVRKIEVALL